MVLTVVTSNVDTRRWLYTQETRPAKQRIVSHARKKEESYLAAALPTLREKVEEGASEA